MLYLANSVVSFVGFEETLILLLGAISLASAFVLYRIAGWSKWLLVASALPLLGSLYLDVSCWRVNHETVNLLRSTHAISESQADLFLAGMQNDMISISIVGAVASLAIWVVLRRLGTSRRSDRTNGNLVDLRSSAVT